MKITVEQSATDIYHELSLLKIQCEGIERAFRVDLDFSAIINFSWQPHVLGLDFLVICACVYAVDKIVPRDEAADMWTRTLEVTIPVRNRETWVAASGSLAEAISFLTGDSWSFKFTVAPRNFSQRRSNRRVHAPGFPKTPVVSLLSGGLDSLIGAINLLHEHPEVKLLFVSHYDRHVSGPATDQNNLRQLLSLKYGQRIRHVQVRVGALAEESNDGRYNFETSFRSRSLIFLGLAVYSALKVGDGVPILIPENGPISVNMPLNPSRRGACSTRTVHPFFISSINRVLSMAGIPHVVRNPYYFKTKGEMVKECVGQEALKLGIPSTNSCGKAGRKQYWANKKARACGVCVPCLLRRAALNVAGLDSGVYGNEAFSGDPTDYADLHALMGLVYAKPSQNEIKRRLMANGRIPLSELSQHADVVQRMIQEVTAWVAAKGSAKVCKLAGVKRQVA